MGGGVLGELRGGDEDGEGAVCGAGGAAGDGGVEEVDVGSVH